VGKKDEVDIPFEKASFNLASNLLTAAKSPYMYSYLAQASHKGRDFSAGMLSADFSNKARASIISLSLSLCKRDKEGVLTCIIIDRQQKLEMLNHIIHFIWELFSSQIKDLDGDR
jgi:hypothetical protein